MRLRHAGVALALTVLVGLAGCGGDDEDPGGGTAATGDGSVVPTTEPTDDSGTPDDEGFCAEVEQIRDRLENLDSLPDAPDPEAAIGAIEESIDALRSVDPPAEIAEDWSTVTEAFEGTATGLRDLDLSDPEVLAQQLEDLAARMEQQSAEIEEAGTRIDQYLSDECGIVLD
jgi:hypothetical protein